MQQEIKDYLKQLVTQDTAAQIKGWSVSTFKFRASKPGAPEAIHIGRNVYYNESEVRDWKPTTQPKGRKRK